MIRRFKVVWRDRNGILHGTAATFANEAAAERWAALLRRDPAVTGTRLLAVVLWPILPPRRDPAA